MKLKFFKLQKLAPKIISGRPDRSWMDNTPDRFAYRCLPLTIANSMGWEVLCPCGIEAEWNGGPEISDLEVLIENPDWSAREIAGSHFGGGILTFQVGYLVKTEKGTGTSVRGVPNSPKDGIMPLEGFVETDWLPFTFTMNWKFTRPGRIRFEEEEPFCFLSPARYRTLEKIKPEITPIENSPHLKKYFQLWSKERKEFNQRLLQEDPATVKQAWQKWYTLGVTSDGKIKNKCHLTKLRVRTPLDLDVD